MNYKIAANPLPIPEGEIILIVQDFMTKIKKNLISKIGTKLFSAWVLHYDELPSSFYDNYF